MVNRIGHMINHLSYHIKDITCASLDPYRISSAEPRALGVKSSHWEDKISLFVYLSFYPSFIDLR